MRLPVLLYIPNLICYGRLILSFYGLSIVAHTVARQQEDARHAAHDGGSSCSVQAMMQTATFYATQISNSNLLPPAANTLLGKGLGHLSAAFGGDGNRQKGNDSDGPAFLLSVEPDLLAALLVFVADAALDLLDGYVARRLNQTSQLGAMLDIFADNVLRSCMWVSSALLDARLALPALLCLSVEWATLLATHLVAQREDGRHWKMLRDADPWLVQYFFSNNFRNVLGMWGIGSLFLAPLYPLLLHAIPALGRMGSAGLQRGGRGGRGGKNGEVGATVIWGLGSVLVVGRILSLAIELYFVWGLVVVLVEEQEEGRRGKVGGAVLRERHKVA